MGNSNVYSCFCLKRLFLGLFLILTSVYAHASSYEVDPYEYENDIGVVQKKRFDPVGRFNVNLIGGLNPFNSLLSDFMVGFGLQYNFLHWLGLDLRGYKHSSKEKTLFDDTKAKVEPARQADFFIDLIDSEVSAHLVWIPVYGKQHLWSLSEFHFLMYLFIGASFLSFKEATLSNGNERKPESSAGLSIGAGIQIFLSNLFHISFELRDVLYTDNSYNKERTQNYAIIQMVIGISLPSFDEPKRKI